MITFTKEQLIASAHARIEFAEMMLAGDLEPLKERTWSIELELARIALASLEAEPSYFVNRVKRSDAYGEDVELRTYCYELDALKSKDDFGGEIVPVYTVPPAPFALPAQHWEELCRQNPDMSIGDAIIRAAWWNHCAAMLQAAGNSESQHAVKVSPLLNSSVKDIELQHADTRVKADGNSPVNQDGWVLVPVEPTMAMLDEFDSIIDYGAEDSKEAWSRLIATVPQQEVKP